MPSLRHRGKVAVLIRHHFTEAGKQCSSTQGLYPLRLSTSLLVESRQKRRGPFLGGVCVLLYVAPLYNILVKSTSFRIRKT